MKKLVPLVLLFVLAMPGAASDTPARRPDQVNLQEIRRNQERLSADLQARRGAFKDMPPEKREELNRKQQWVLARIEGHTSLETLEASERVDVFNGLEWINATVADAEGDRKICERSRIAGSNRFQVVCSTAADVRKNREGAMDSMRRAHMCNASREACLEGRMPQSGRMRSLRRGGR